MIKSNIHKILFITLSNIGDAVLTLPVLSGLRDNFPDAVIDVVAGPRTKDIFNKDPRIGDIFIYDKRSNLKEKVRFIKKLKKRGHDLAIDMKTSLIPLLIGTRYRTAIFSLYRTKGHKRSRHLTKLKELGLKYKEGRNLYIDDRDRKKVLDLLERNGCDKGDIVIGVSPSARGLLKQWQTDDFIKVIGGLLKEKDCKIVLIGDDVQKDVSRKIKDSVRDTRVIDLTGKTTLNELFALIERLNLILTCDSACLHIASDLGMKVVAIFGPTDPAEYGPLGRDGIVIRRNLKCSPCNKAVCRFNHECMKEISAEEVLRALGKSL